ncbi:MAG: B12-binding domain-containing radical SAM protein [Promethearchaeota archaeon]
MIWNKILLVVTNYKTPGYDFYDSAFPPLALEYIAAHVEDLVEVKILDTKAGNLGYKKIIKEFEKYKPDLVGFTVPVTSAITTVLAHAKLAKQVLNCTTVIGGWHPTLAVEETLSSPWIDILVRGEGENTFRELIEKGSPEGVKGLSYKVNGVMIHNEDRPFIKDINTLKFPARNLVNNYKYRAFYLKCDAIETSRGCPQGCRFCSTHVVYKRKWRARSVENIIQELELISKNRRISDVFFVDDNILVNMNRIGKMCIEIIKAKREGRIKKRLRFFFQGRLDSMARHPKIVKLMALAGFWLVLVGVEATDNNRLKKVEKGCKIEQIRKGIEVLHENGIIVMGNVIIGANLDDSIDDVFVTIKKTRELTLDIPSFTLLTPFPSTEFYREMKERNLLLTEDYSKFNWLNPVIKTTNFSSSVLKKLLFLGFYYIGFYGGSWSNKITVLKRIARARGFRFFLNPYRISRGINAYLKWYRMVKRNISDIKRKAKYQLRLGKLNKMLELKEQIISI